MKRYRILFLVLLISLTAMLVSGDRTFATGLLSVSKDGSGTGAVKSRVAGIDCGTDCIEDYTSDDAVTLFALPDSGSYFGGWSGDCVSQALTCIVKMDTAMNVAATFVSGTASPVTWWKTIGGGLASENQYLYSIQQTSDGGYIGAGSAYNTDTDSDDLYVVKLDQNGITQWEQIYSLPAYMSKASSIQQTSDGGYIVAGVIDYYYSWDVWVLKLDGSGNLVWEYTYDSSVRDEAFSIQQTSDGGYVFAGHCDTGTDPMSPPEDFCITKIDENGELAWQKIYDGSDTDKAMAISQTRDGGYIVVGFTYSFNALAYDTDAWVLKLDSSGDIQWQRLFGNGNGSYDEARSVYQTHDDGYVVAGVLDGGFWAVKLDSSGERLWERTFNWSPFDVATSVQQTYDGGIIVAGSSEGDIWIMKLDNADGQHVWQKIYDISPNDEVYTIQQTSDGGFVFSGVYLEGEYDRHIQVLKTDGDGNISGCPANYIEPTNVTGIEPDYVVISTSVSAQDISPVVTGTNEVSQTVSNMPQNDICSGYADCAFMFLPAYQIADNSGGNFIVTSTPEPLSCNWTAYTENSWINITSGGSGTGVGDVNYTVSQNTGRARDGYIYFGGETDFSVIQDGTFSELFFNPENGNYYRRFDMVMNWFDARDYCESQGGYLATITSTAEQDFVYTNLVEGGSSYLHECWLGGYQSETATSPDTDWAWVTGEPWGYTNWCNIDEICYSPDDLGIYGTDYEDGEENHLSIWHDWGGAAHPGTEGTWNDLSASQLRIFICEWTQQYYYTLDVSKTGTGSGTVRSSEVPAPQINCCSGCAEPVCSSLYFADSSVILTATPDTGSVFIGWSGDCRGFGQCLLILDGDKYVTAAFARNIYTVSTQKTSGGDIVPGTATVSHGDTADFSIIAASGYHIGSVTGCGGGFTDNPTLYRTGPVTSNCTVSVTFALNTYTVSTALNGGGTISPSSRTVEHGNNSQFILTPFAGYHILSVTGCGGTLSEGTLNANLKKKKKKKMQALSGLIYTTGPVTESCTVTATFEINAYTLTASAGAGGSINPGSANVNHGDAGQFTLTPDEGYHIKSVNGTCGGSLDGNIYTTNPVTDNCTVEASFEINQYVVSASAGQGGLIDPAGRTVTHGDTAQFTIIPDTGYHILSVTGCGGTLSEGTLNANLKKKKKKKMQALSGFTYTTGPVTESCTVTATFEINAYTLTGSAGAGGSISPGSANVNHGDTGQFTLTPEEGYNIKSVNGTCGGSLEGNTYTTNPVTGSCSVEASFEINQYVVSASAGQGGLIDPAGRTVTHGDTAQFTIIPDTGYHILSVTGCGGTLSDDGTYTTGMITADCAITALFEVDTYSLTILKSGTGNGTISAPGLFCDADACSGEYVYGARVLLRINTDAGSRVADVKIDGISIGAVNSITFKKLMAGHSIEIIFAPI
jgi:hypothetical protein